MAAEKKTKKKTRSTASARRKMMRAKKMTMKRENPKRSVKKKEAQRKAAIKRKVIGKTTAAKTSHASRKQVLEKSQGPGIAFSGLRSALALSGGQSGDLQGLSMVEGADSESVDELLEEGNPFEAGVVTGVEDADDAEEKEVRTHEVLEDDVPDEYLDKD